MKIVSVAPISRGVLREPLSYFSRQPIQPGALVSVAIRNKEVTGLVTDVADWQAVGKMNLKKLDYEIKKISRLRADSFFQPAFISAAKTAADYFVVGLGTVLKSLVPSIVIRQAESFRLPQKAKITPAINQTARVNKKEVLVIQEPTRERFLHYKGLVREAFAKKSSVLVIVPTVAATKQIAEFLSKGIEKYTAVLHSGLSPRTVASEWQRIIDLPHPVLVIGTPIFLSLPRNDWQTIIVEDESDKAYQPMAAESRGLIDSRRFASWFAEAIPARLVLGASMLRTETVFRFEHGDFSSLSSVKYRAVSNTPVTIIDAKQERLDQDSFTAFTPNARQIVKTEWQSGHRVAILSSRRGLLPIVICQDCQTTLRCDHCGKPLTVHETAGKSSGSNSQGSKRIFSCHRCGKQQELIYQCRDCGSWRLTGLGIGLEEIRKEVKRWLPEAKTFILEGEVVSNRQAAEKIIAETSSHQGILLGTETMLRHLYTPVDLLVAMVDSWFSVPDYHARERLFRNLLLARELTGGRLVIQTRLAGEPIFNYLKDGNLLDFYREELIDRKRYGYPPFKTLIKITYHGGRAMAVDTLQALASGYESFEPTIYRSEPYPKSPLPFLLLRAGGFDSELWGKLKKLPPSLEVTIDPDSLFS